MKKHKGLSVVLVAGLTLTLGALVEARRSGAAAGYNGSIASSGLTCMECHTPGTGGGGEVEILGVPAQYENSMVYDLTVRVSDAAQVGGGFQISAEDASGNRAGDLTLTDAGRTKYSGSSHHFVTHTSDGVDDSIANWAANGNSVEYPVRWTAPGSAMGAITFYAAGNAINDNFLTTGDYIYLTQVPSLPSGFDCGAINAVTAKCKDGAFKVVGLAKTSLAEGTMLHLTLDGGDTKMATVNRRGKAKANWKNVAGGGHTVCLVECPEECGSTTCNP